MTWSALNDRGVRGAAFQSMGCRQIQHGSLVRCAVVRSAARSRSQVSPLAGMASRPVVGGVVYAERMSARPMKCPGCGEQRRLRITRYVPQVELMVEHQSHDGSYTAGAASPAEARYECLQCGVFVEHFTMPLSAAMLERFGFVTG